MCWMAKVVPHDDVVRLPLVLTHVFGPRDVVDQPVDQQIRLLVGHALEAERGVVLT